MIFRLKPKNFENNDKKIKIKKVENKGRYVITTSSQNDALPPSNANVSDLTSTRMTVLKWSSSGYQKDSKVNLVKLQKQYVCIELPILAAVQNP